MQPNSMQRLIKNDVFTVILRASPGPRVNGAISAGRICRPHLPGCPRRKHRRWYWQISSRLLRVRKGDRARRMYGFEAQELGNMCK